MANKNDRQRIVEILNAFSVGVESIDEQKGPSTTLYEIQPKLGVRISRIRNLKDEIAVGLQSDNVRIIAPIPGKGTVGIEVPNKVREILPIEDILSSDEYKSTDMELPCALGRTVSNGILMADLAKMPHLLIAGATGQGKSVCLNTILASLLHKKTPDEMRLILIDPKQVEFSLYSKLGTNSYLAKPIGTDITAADVALDDTINLMEDRYTLLDEKGVRNIKEYNAIQGVKKMPYLVFIIDEYGDLILQNDGGTEIERKICRIAQKARAVGIHLIISTQRPSVKIITGDIKANFPTRIAFRTITSTDSRVVLGKKGAEALTGKGDMLFFDGEKTVRTQCAFTPTEYVKDMCDYLGEKYSTAVVNKLFKEPQLPPEPGLPTWKAWHESGKELPKIDEDVEFWAYRLERKSVKYGGGFITDYEIQNYIPEKYEERKEKAQRIFNTLVFLNIIVTGPQISYTQDTAMINIHQKGEADRIFNEYRQFYFSVVGVACEQRTGKSLGEIYWVKCEKVPFIMDDETKTVARSMCTREVVTVSDIASYCHNHIIAGKYFKRLVILGIVGDEDTLKNKEPSAKVNVHTEAEVDNILSKYEKWSEDIIKPTKRMLWHSRLCFIL